MKTISFPVVLTLVTSVLLLTCTNNEALFDPTGETGITVSAFVCDTTGVDTTITVSDSISGTVAALSVYAGQTITFLGFVKGESVSDIRWKWNFGDNDSSLSRIEEHRYMTEGDYKAVFTITNSGGISLSDTVHVTASGISPHAAVKGYAFLQGKTIHDGIEVLLKSDVSPETFLTTNETGLFQKLNNVPYGTYTIYYTYTKSDCFSPDTLNNITITNNILNELGKTTLKGLPPTVDAGNDTVVGFGSTINLHGTAIDNGAIIKWEWKIGNNPWIVTSDGDTSIIAPSNTQTFVCSLRVTDDDKANSTDFMNVHVKAIFTPHTITTSADGASSVFALDVDGDGDIDVLSASRNDNRIAWYENDGSENFTMHKITTSAVIANSVFAIDVDGDSDIDVLSASGNDNTIAWYENDGAENFINHTITTSANGANSVFAIDVDSDGDIDALSASGNDNTIAWYENDGAENFIDHTITASANNANSVIAIDIDRDGDIDLLSGSVDFVDHKTAWYENDGNENFTTHTISTDSANSVYAIDINGDGDIDVMSVSYDASMIRWYENDGNENFATHTITTTANGTLSVYAIDVDGDEDIDVLIAYYNGIAWYENDGQENFTEHILTTSGSNGASVFAMDVDGDGDIDALSAGANKIVWYENGD